MSVFYLVGEKNQTRSLEVGRFQCPVCGDEQQYAHFEESRYFTFFMFPIARLEKVADYCQCSVCCTSYIPDQYDIPAHTVVVRRVLVYIMLGYNMQQNMDTVIELNEKITGQLLDRTAINREMEDITRSNKDIFEFLREKSFNLNIQGKQKVIEAAFLMTYVSCEIEYEDRLRVNLIANALGTSLEFTQAVINSIREHGYYGIKRRLTAVG